MSERALCSRCHGNGVQQIPGGIQTCPRCGGDCWEPQPSGGVWESLSDEEQQLICDALAAEAADLQSERWPSEAKRVDALRRKLFPAPPGGEAPRETDQGLLGNSGMDNSERPPSTPED